jgi:transposase
MIHELLDSLRAERCAKEQLQQRLDRLLRQHYGPRSARVDPNPLPLFPDVFTPPATPAADAAAPDVAPLPADETPPRRRHRGGGRRRLPRELPRVVERHELTAAERCCPDCGQERQIIGEERSEPLDFRPASLFVRAHVRCTYACPHCQGQVMTADKPDAPVPKGLPGPGLLAQVIVSKYSDHLPLYRLERIFGRQGRVLPRATQCDWAAAAARLLQPLYALMIALALESRVLHTDDTPVKARHGQRPGSHTGRFWGYLGDATQPYHVFDYTTNRKRDGPVRFLANYQGYLQADAFSGYDGLYVPQKIQEVGCPAHARRKFYEARSTDAVRAHEALAYYRTLYALERQALEAAETLCAQEPSCDPVRFADVLAAERYRRRQAEAKPLLEKFHTWRTTQQAQLLPKSPLSEAVGYALNQWTALTRYLESGYLAIDNNWAEREMKRIAIGRKNWLFVGSDAGGKTAAVLFSFTATCQRHGIDPWAYLTDVLTRLPTLPAERLAELLPDRWQAARMAAAAPTPVPAAAEPCLAERSTEPTVVRPS